MIAQVTLPLTAAEEWHACRFLTCSVLPVRMACNLRCPFCFSKSSVSALKGERVDWRGLDVAGYYEFARDRGATRLVLTGGGEPLLRPDDVAYLVGLGRRYFDEVACFSNGTFLSRELSRRLLDAGLSYLCWSRHAAGDGENRLLMGEGAPRLDDLVEAAGPLRIRATCVMMRGHVEDAAGVWGYVEAFREYGIEEFTFKHTYVAHEGSLFRGSEEDAWARGHRVEGDPFAGEGEVVARLPWGPCVRRLRGVQVCYYHEPTPQWELKHQLCRSSNLLSDGTVYASLEETRSLLYRLSCS
jgi:MoaA/NifB/PqqE/SkfB family radical SAM enzyme